MDQVKSVITLRSGKVIEKPTLEPCERDDESISEGKEGVESEHSKEKTDSPSALPFPHAMTKQRKVNHNSEIFETFKQVRIKIHLLDAIKHVPSYAKFLKDLFTVKRKLNVKKKAFLTEQVSNILQNNNALKYKDLGCPIISCFIGEHKIEKALLDLEASVNLLPYSVFQSLNLGELKPTSVTLLLTDRSVKVLRAIVKDVLVQVDKFIYPVDFIVLDTQPVEACNLIPVILGYSFLATSNALINCRDRVMKLSFENITLEMNIFNICKQPEYDNDLQEVDFIETKIDESNDLQMVYFQEELKANSWRPKIEELPPRSIESIPLNVQPPKLDLKSLPFNLKYSFLEENETFPVIISSRLNAHQEGKLLQTLKMHKNALVWTIADIKGISPLICTHRI